MIDKEYELLERFIEGAKESYEKVENHSYIFPITILKAYQISKIIEKLLKEQETTSTAESRLFHCEKCGYGIDDIYLSNEHDFDIYPHFCPNCGRKVKWDDT